MKLSAIVLTLCSMRIARHAKANNSQRYFSLSIRPKGAFIALNQL